MRDIIKNSRKNGMKGYKARRALRIGAFAFGMLMLIGAVLVCTGGITGILAGGALIATVPALAFTVPDDATETEKKGMENLAEALNKVFKEFDSSKISTEQCEKKMQEALKSWSEKEGITKEQFEKMRESLKKQGEVITALKESGHSRVSKSGATLKDAFDKNWDTLRKNILNRAQTTLKVIDEHNPDYIHTTDNISRTTTGADLFETERVDPNLHEIRRDREYIRDIADVTVVENVPETFSYWDEGDTEGNFAIVEENALKPQMKLDVIKNRVEAQKVAGYIVVTEEVLKWRSRTWAFIRRLWNNKFRRDYDDILTTQMMVNATAYTTTPLDGTIDNPSNFEALIAAIAQLEMLNFSPDTLVINPADKWILSMTTLGTNQLILPYIQNGGTFAILGLRVIISNKIPAGNFLLGESGTWFIEEEMPQLRTGLVNDDHIHNRYTIVMETFFLSYVPSSNAGAWIYGNFAEIKEALAAPAAPAEAA